MYSLVDSEVRVPTGLVPSGDSEDEFTHVSVPASGGCGGPWLVDTSCHSGSVFPWPSFLCFLKSPSAFSLKDASQCIWGSSSIHGDLLLRSLT